MSSRVLSDRLQELTEKGIIERKVIHKFPVTTEYHLTEKGKSLNKVMYELAAFAIETCHECCEDNSKTSHAYKFLRKKFKIE